MLKILLTTGFPLTSSSLYTYFTSDSYSLLKCWIISSLDFIRFQFFCESGGKGCIGLILEINIIKAIVIMVIIRDFSFSTYAKFSEKLAFLTPAPFLDAQTYVCLSGGKKCSFFEKFYVRTELITYLEPQTCFHQERKQHPYSRWMYLSVKKTGSRHFLHWVHLGLGIQEWTK